MEAEGNDNGNGKGGNEVSAAAPKTSGSWLNILRWIADSILIPCKLPVISPLVPFHWVWGTYSFGRHGCPTVIGTILCPAEDKMINNNNNKVRVCFEELDGSEPLLLLDLPIGICDLLNAGRITLESESGPQPLLMTSTWTVYCNGKKVGFAHRRERKEADAQAMEAIRAISAGMGILPEPSSGGGRRLRYMRSSFERVLGSADCESYHLIDPRGWLGQELSFFFLRL